MVWRRLGRLVLAAAVLAAASGCGGKGSALYLGDEGLGRLCAPAPTGDSAIIFGGEVLRNLDERPVTITGVSLVGAQDLTLVGAFLVETRLGRDLVGVGFEHPNGQPPPNDWLAADDAVVQPGEEWNLVLLVTTNAEDTASARAARIEYENASGRRYYQDTITEMLVARRPCHEVLSPDDRSPSDPPPS